MRYADYLATCHRIDIALDPFPHAGATTTLDTLCMGVPVLSLRGTTPAGRLGESILTTANLADWLAQSPEEYIEKAVRFAADLPRLVTLRAALREKLAASPLMNAPRFTRHFEQALRTAWHTWCETKP
jgi:predicted O-linked N-acetylglucosamine transferase (SPINDLY family)